MYVPQHMSVPMFRSCECVLAWVCGIFFVRERQQARAREREQAREGVQERERESTCTDDSDDRGWKEAECMKV